MDDERRELGLDVDVGDQTIHFLGAGGNGLVFNHVINGRQYAVKLVSCDIFEYPWMDLLSKDENWLYSGTSFLYNIFIYISVTLGPKISGCNREREMWLL